jgi:uncharacterized repeat protein (TIGR01451 family)
MNRRNLLVVALAMIFSVFSLALVMTSLSAPAAAQPVIEPAAARLTVPNDNSTRTISPVSQSDLVPPTLTLPYDPSALHDPTSQPRQGIDVNYAHDWVHVNTKPLNTVTLTYRSAGGDLATYVGQADGWGELYTDGQYWNPPNPDIQPGDAVTVTSAGLATVVNPIGTVNGTLNVAADTISGTINAPFGSTLLTVRCEVWTPNGPPPIEVQNVSANGGSYFCDYSGWWDIVVGNSVAVRYIEPDGDTVINVFDPPAPNLRVEKWAEGSGEVQAGSAVIFSLRYRNEGNDVAENVMLTDTLPGNTYYITDSSGLPLAIGAGEVVWQIGTLQPGAYGQFQIVLTNTASPGDVLTNTADIATTSLGDQTYNNHAEATVNVGSGQPDLYVNKNANPGDPTPGQNFDYYLNYGNNNSVASGPAWLTDTLPPSTTLVSWMSNNQYNVWTQVSAANGQVGLYAPAVPGNYGDQIILTLHLDANATYGTQLTNTVEIMTAGDSNLGDNQHTNDGTKVSPPRYGVSLNKSWGHGSLVSGQHVNYWLSFNNNGNMLAPNVVMTDVLPNGVTFVAATRDVGQGNEVPYPPTSITGNVLRWNVGSMAVAKNQNVRIELAIPPTLAAGTVLTNCAEIATSAIEKDPYDNASCTVDIVRPAGPNLRVVKYASWNNPNRVRYDVQIANIGSQTIQDVHITDTLPVSMSVSWWKIDFWDQWTGNQSGYQITLTLTRLEPYWTTWLHIEADVPDVPGGTFFTNTVRIDAPPGEVNPQDNVSTSVIGTGPDLTIAKWQSSGAAQAQQLLTYTLHFKNDSQWQTNGNVLLTDTLPVGQWCNGCWNDLIVTVRVTNTLPVGAIFTNTAAIASDQFTADREPNYTNNSAVSVIQSPVFRIYLPLIKK